MSKQRSFWLRQLHQWHWMSSAACLVGMLLFAITGITLNHATQIESSPAVTGADAQLPDDLVALLRDAKKGAALPAAIVDWVTQELKVDVTQGSAEFSEEEIYVSLPRPGGDAWLSIDVKGGSVHYELTERGWISYLNDLHKGRNTGLAWSWFIDVFAVACLLFCATGLILLQLHARHRPATWPMVGVGMLIPLVLAILFIH